MIQAYCYRANFRGWGTCSSTTPLSAGPHDDDEVERDEDDYNERMNKPLLRSCGRTLRYHIGTVMFGGFVIASVQFVRAIMEYVDANTRTWQEKNKVSCFLDFIH